MWLMFSLCVSQLCGAIKSWKRAQDPTSGSSKGFGFCEFDSADGVLRALRLLNKFALDGQELVVCIFCPPCYNQVTNTACLHMVFVVQPTLVEVHRRRRSIHVSRLVKI